MEWRGLRTKPSNVQILPPNPDAPRDHHWTDENPFILEFPFQTSLLWEITNYRRMREHRNLTLLLNVLLASRTSLQPRRSEHCWALIRGQNDKIDVRWVQKDYYARLGKCVLDAHSNMTDERVVELEPVRYFQEIRGLDGKNLRIPTNLDDSICRYQQLHPLRREAFNRATFWIDMAYRQWSFSISASFAAYVSAIEALANKRGSGGPTLQFREFWEEYAPQMNQRQRKMIYSLRSGILHGSRLISVDEGSNHGWDPPWHNERNLIEELWTMTKVAMRNWLNNPPPFE